MSFLGEKRLLGVVHLPPLPGSPRHAGRLFSEIIEHARRDAATLLDCGFDGYVIENFGDVPFYKDRVPPHVLTCMTRIACELPRDGAHVVVNVLRNDASGALSVALAAGLAGIRVNVHSGAMVTDQGIMEGRAAVTVRERAQLAPDVAILADVDVKHATPVGAGFSLEEAAEDTARRGLADALIITGRATGSAALPADLDRIRAVVPDRPIWVGSGVTASSASAWYERADGIIVGSALKSSIDAPIDAAAARAFTRACR